jgi:hypothetical protein
MSYNPMSNFLPPEARQHDPRDPDNALVALFRNHAIENLAKSKEAGRPIYDDVEYCEIRAPGSKDVKVYPAAEISRDIVRTDPYTGAVENHLRRAISSSVQAVQGHATRTRATPMRAWRSDQPARPNCAR